MGPEVLAILSDPGLTDLARVLAFYIASKGPGAHEIPLREFCRVGHGYPTPETISAHLKQLERAGYLERRPGGRGHFDSYQVTCPAIVEKDSTGFPPGAKETPPTDSTGPEPGPIQIAQGDDRELNGPVVVEEIEVVKEPPVVPLSASAEQALAKYDAKLAGCRGALRDYLAHIVRNPFRQYSYVQTVAVWMDDGDPSVWQLPTGGWLPRDERAKVLAVALNELATNGEKLERDNPGSPDNLRKRIRYILSRRGNDGGKAGRSGTRAAAGSTPAQSDQSARRQAGFGG
jgi:DNA-binding transcriptional ArsR family regulator